jgi:hypothetical protein
MTSSQGGIERHPFPGDFDRRTLGHQIRPNSSCNGTPATAHGFRGAVAVGWTSSGGRQLDTQMVADARLDLCHRSGGVDRHDDFLGAEQVQDRPGHFVIVPQAGLDRLGGVVGPGHQLAAAHVADAGHRRAGGDEVVVNPARRAQTPAKWSCLEVHA